MKLRTRHQVVKANGAKGYPWHGGYGWEWEYRVWHPSPLFLHLLLRRIKKEEAREELHHMICQDTVAGKIDRRNAEKYGWGPIVYGTKKECKRIMKWYKKWEYKLEFMAEENEKWAKEDHSEEWGETTMYANF